jgi:hypothetical protein
VAESSRGASPGDPSEEQLNPSPTRALSNDSSAEQLDNVSIYESPNDPEERFNHLIQRMQELQDRRSLLELRKLQLKRSAKLVDEAEYALKEQKELAAVADRMVERRSFRDHFCGLYRSYQPVTEVIEAVAELVVGVITQLYPHWLADFWAASSVAVLSSVVILRKGIAVYCAASS